MRINLTGRNFLNLGSDDRIMFLGITNVDGYPCSVAVVTGSTLGAFIVSNRPARLAIWSPEHGLHSYNYGDCNCDDSFFEFKEAKGLLLSNRNDGGYRGFILKLGEKEYVVAEVFSPLSAPESSTQEVQK